MRNFNHHKRTASRGSYHDEHRETYRAVCSSCGAECTVPFRPNGRKPVFCNACFKKNADGNDSRNFQDRGSTRPGFSKRADYGNRPDFEKRHDFRPQNNEQFEKLNRKLDRIIELMTANYTKIVPVPAVPAPAPKKKKQKKEEAAPIPQKTDTG